MSLKDFLKGEMILKINLIIMFLTKGTKTNYLIFMSKSYAVNMQNKWETFKYFQASESPWFLYFNTNYSLWPRMCCNILSKWSLLNIIWWDHHVVSNTLTFNYSQICKKNLTCWWCYGTLSWDTLKVTSHTIQF